MAYLIILVKFMAALPCYTANVILITTQLYVGSAQ